MLFPRSQGTYFHRQKADGECNCIDYVYPHMVLVVSEATDWPVNRQPVMIDVMLMSIRIRRLYGANRGNSPRTATVISPKTLPSLTIPDG